LDKAQLSFAPEGLSRIAGGVSRREMEYENAKALKGNAVNDYFPKKLGFAGFGNMK
jgi:hypothetical protein